MSKIKKILFKNFFTKSLFLILSVTLILSLVLWEDGTPLAPIAIFNKLSNPHSIDFVDDFLVYWYSILKTVSFCANIAYIWSVIWFFSSLNNGTLRWGGKAAND